MQIKVFFISVFISITSFGQNVYFDQTLDSNIRTIQHNNLIPLNAQVILEFDYLGGDAPYMLAKIIHCDWDWKESIIMESEFFEGFNESQLGDVEGSSSPYIPYYHYRFAIPKVKLSGNYVVKLFDEDNESKVYMYRRFSVYNDKIVISSSRTLDNVVKHRYSHQQIDFQLSYNQMEIQDPYQNMHTVIRQNSRWDNAKVDLKPTYINEAEKVLKFNYYGGESSFAGTREYRQFSYGRRTYWLDNFEKSNTGTKVFLRKDIDRSYVNYVDEADRNGRYEVDSPYDADYSHIHFRLKLDKSDDDIYVFGQLSDWRLDQKFKLNYDSTTSIYSRSILLKNGEYDFTYAMDRPEGPNEVILQGSHSETQNSYEILIYYRAFGKYYDELIGYKRL